MRYAEVVLILEITRNNPDEESYALVTAQGSILTGEADDNRTNRVKGPEWQ